MFSFFLPAEELFHLVFQPPLQLPLGHACHAVLLAPTAGGLGDGRRAMSAESDDCLTRAPAPPQLGEQCLLTDGSVPPLRPILVFFWGFCVPV